MENPPQSANENRILNINIGILGHVDSGKTSLVKALSTSLSTAALDKHPQSQQRGITLDLGFSAFTLPLWERIQSLLISKYGVNHGFDLIQFTLVDCPGHASLIRTIIGGAQIIDMIILVVDANKGIQTQTAECIVIGEITTDILIIALNKADLLPEHEREERIAKITKKIHKTLSTSKFSSVTIIPVSASVGGEKVAANTGLTSSNATLTKNGLFKSNTSSDGIEHLVDTIKDLVVIPARNIHSSFYFAIDHCFPIKGHGTVMTGTVLSGSVSVNQTIEIPSLQATKKVKSMQMFHKPVKYAQQGDRVGICVTNLDAKLIERGIAATPNTIPLISSAICLVKKIRFFRYPCKSSTKFHISIGHETVVATATFFGGNELQTKLQSLEQEKQVAPSSSSSLSSSHTEENNFASQSTLSASYHQLFPPIDFDWDNDHSLQEEIISTANLVYGKEPVQWVLLQFQQQVYCPLGSLIIGSRFDVDSKDHHHPSSSSSASAITATPSLLPVNSHVHQCRLAFYGPVKDMLVNPELDLHRLGIFIWKQKECEISRLVDCKGPLCYEAIGWRLITEGSNIQNYIGMKLLTERGIVGTIVSSYGTDGKFRVKFPNGAKISVGGKLIFKYKKFIYQRKDSSNNPETNQIKRNLLQQNIEFNEDQLEEITQEDEEAFQRELDKISLAEVEEKVLFNQQKNSKKKIKNLIKEKRKNEIREESQPETKHPISEIWTSSENIDSVLLSSASNKPAVNNGQQSTEIASTTPEMKEPEPEPVLSLNEPILQTTNTNSFHSLSVSNPNQEIRTGKIESIKNESTDPPFDQIIVSGAFKMEENIRLYLGAFCMTEKDEIGELTGSFGKMGKCKIKIPGNCTAPLQSSVKIIIERKK
jgi:selenocysteine-specific elongation factor